MSTIKSIGKKNRQKIFEGGCKDVFQVNDDDSSLIMFFKDELKHNNEKICISGKGIINNSISSCLMEKIDLVGIQNHLIEKMNMREQMVQILDIVPIQIRISNVAVGDYVAGFGVQEGYLFDNPMIEYRVKNRVLGSPAINESQIVGFNWATETEISEIKKLAYRVNDFLSGFFSAINLRLIECNLEFGRVFNGEEFIFMLADEITPESLKLWDLNSNQKFDIDSIVKSENPIEIYKEVANRMGIKA